MISITVFQLNQQMIDIKDFGAYLMIIPVQLAITTENVMVLVGPSVPLLFEPE